ncbi:MAG: DUF3352 domain-containing protein [Planctomycetes bacterium]|nr:DUF3352 domain-containing protein [Planctomycetota bacterium]
MNLRMRASLVSLLAALATLALPGIVQAQASPRERLLRLVPTNTGVCLVVSDLREHWRKTQDTRWFKTLIDSPVGAALARAPEFGKLVRLEQDFKKHFGVDAAQLRDEILGDAVVFAYTPAQSQRSEDEAGLLLLWARDSPLLAKLVERLNKAQKASGEVTELATVEYAGKSYVRRVERNKTHYYLLLGNLLAVAGHEKSIRDVIDALDREPSSVSPLQRSLRRAGTESALAALWLNPRAFDADLRGKAKGTDPQSQVINAFLKYWQALDGIVLSASLAALPEIRLSVQARANDVPEALRALFARDYQASELWQRFPSKSMLRIAGKIDVPAAVEMVRELTPDPAREAIGNMLRKTLAATLGLDPAKDVLPRLGPDWGICVAAADEAGAFPHVIVALGIQPGPKPVSAGAALFKSAQFFARWAALQHNLANKEPIDVKTAQQDANEVLYLESRLFPAGMRPALKLADGYLLLGSSPEALARFQPGQKVPAMSGAVPLLHLSMAEISAWLQGRRDKVVSFLQEKNQLSPATAGQWLDGLLAGLGLFDNLTLAQRSDAGQVTWILRLREK